MNTIKKFHVIRAHAHADAVARPYAVYAVAHVTTRIAAVAAAWKVVHVVLSAAAASVFRYGHAPPPSGRTISWGLV